MENDKQEQFRQLSSTFDKMKDSIMNAVDVLTKGMSKEEMKVIFRNQNTSLLKEVLEKAGLQKENYEICQAIKEVLEEKKQ